SEFRTREAFLPPCYAFRRPGPRPLGKGKRMDPIIQACDRLGIVGARFREEIAAQVQASVLARRGRDAVRLTGVSGTGKELVTALVHEVAREQLGRSGELVEINCSNLPDSLFES